MALMDACRPWRKSHWYAKWARGSCRGLVGLPCRIFWRRDTFLKDVSYESLVGELFLEESLVGSCRTGFLAQVFFFSMKNSSIKF